MRFLLGVIAGVLLTVGIAFVADSTVTAEVTPDTNRQIVNWEVAQERLHGLTTLVRNGWEWLEHEINPLT
jgi:hypothetical protein